MSWDASIGSVLARNISDQSGGGNPWVFGIGAVVVVVLGALMIVYLRKHRK